MIYNRSVPFVFVSHEGLDVFTIPLSVNAIPSHDIPSDQINQVLSPSHPVRRKVMVPNNHDQA